MFGLFNKGALKELDYGVAGILFRLSSGDEEFSTDGVEGIKEGIEAALRLVDQGKANGFISSTLFGLADALDIDKKGMSNGRIVGLYLVAMKYKAFSIGGTKGKNLGYRISDIINAVVKPQQQQPASSQPQPEHGSPANFVDKEGLLKVIEPVPASPVPKTADSSLGSKLNRVLEYAGVLRAFLQQKNLYANSRKDLESDFSLIYVFGWCYFVVSSERLHRDPQSEQAALVMAFNLIYKTEKFDKAKDEERLQYLLKRFQTLSGACSGILKQCLNDGIRDCQRLCDGHNMKNPDQIITIEKVIQISASQRTKEESDRNSKAAQEKYYDMWLAATDHIKSKAVDGLMSVFITHHNLTAQRPAAHQVFRFGNQLFTVWLEDVVVNDKAYLLSSWDDFLEESREMNAIPCVMLMKHTDAGWAVNEPDWGLLDDEVCDDINPCNLVTDEAVEMTDWEINDFCIQRACDRLLDDQCTIEEVSSYPSSAPSIWFTDQFGSLCYLILGVAKYPIYEVPCPAGAQSVVSPIHLGNGGFNGYYLCMSVASVLDIEEGSGLIYRGDPLIIRQGELTPI